MESHRPPRIVTRFLFLFTTLPLAAQLTAFGDSITAGYGLTLPADRYINRIAAAKSWRIENNYAIQGSSAPDQADFIYRTQPAPGSTAIYTIGTNDAAIYYVGPTPGKLRNFEDAHADELAWLALPASAKVRGLSSTPSFTGIWSPTAPNGPGYGIGVFSTAPGSTVTTQLSGTTIYIGTLVENDGAGEFSLTLDGSPAGSYHCYPDYPIITYYYRPYAPKLIRLPNLSPGPHTLTLTVKKGRVYFDWAGGNTFPPESAPTLLAGGVPRAATDTIGWIWPYTASIARNVTMLAADGLNIRFVDTAAAMNPATDLLDGTHPNPLGSAHLAAAFLDNIYNAAIAPAGVVNALNGQFQPVVAGGLFTLYGIDLPLNGTSLTLAGLPAPILYASPTQINFQAPPGLANLPNADLVITATTQTLRTEVSVSPWFPGLFPTAFRAGSAVTVFATGTQPGLPLSVTIGGKPARILYYGPAPETAGLTRIDAALPPDVPPGFQPVTVTLGGIQALQTPLVFIP